MPAHDRHHHQRPRAPSTARRGASIARPGSTAGDAPATPAPRRRGGGNRARVVFVVVAFVVSVAGSVAAITSGATAGTAADRGAAFELGPAPEPPVFGRIVLITDSALAGIRWNGHLDALTDADWDGHLESCRRLVYPSCRGREGYAPRTALREIEVHAERHGPTRPVDVLVVGTGYNDWESRFRDDFRSVVAAARRHGFRRIVWLTYRDETAYRLPGGVGALFASYTAMNAILFDELASGAYPDVNVWDYRSFTSGRPEWFTADGVHLTSEGSSAVAQWFSSHFGPDSPPWINS